MGIQIQMDLFLGMVVILAVSSGVFSQLDCNFDTDLCKWTQDVNSDDFDWIRQHGSTPSRSTGPTQDHTSGDGSYLFLETSVGARGSTARINSPEFASGDGKEQCFQFWYHMYGQSIEELNVYFGNRSRVETLVWSKSGDQGDRWALGEVSIGSNGEDVMLIIEAVKGVTFRGDIALDDVKLLPGPCTVIPEPSPNATRRCDFESNQFCDWTQGEDNNFDWSRFGDGEPIGDTDPNFDRTLGSSQGHYISAPTASKWPKGAKGRFISPSYMGGTPKCFRFHYFMFNGSTETLNVYARGYTGLGGTLWSKTGAQGDKWLRDEATIPAESSPQQIILEAVSGDMGANIAIDDIRITDGACVPGSCDFQGDLCSWINDNSDDFDWTRKRGATKTKGTGPQSDHTLGTDYGYYLFIEASSPQVEGDQARLISERFPATKTTTCLTFLFHMHGNSVGSLKVKIKKQQRREKTLWSYGKPMGEDWVQASVPIKKSNHKYKIIFEATRGPGFTSDIALDDILFMEGNCAVMPADAVTTPAPTTTIITTTPTTTTTRATTRATTKTSIPTTESTVPTSNTTIQTKATIPSMSTTINSTTPATSNKTVTTSKQTPTTKKPPTKKTKEDLSASCSFESTCTWSNTGGDDFDWQVVDSYIGVPDNASKADHTVGAAGNGSYAYVGAGNATGDRAWSVSEDFNTTRGRCLEFWYAMNGQNTGTLNVLLRTSDVDGNTTDGIIWQLSGHQGDMWTRAHAPLASKASYNIIFEGIVADGSDGVIAIDDISFRQGSCKVQPTAANTAKPTSRPPPTVDPSINCASEGLLCPGQDPGDGMIDEGSGALPTEEAVKMPTSPMPGMEPNCTGDNCDVNTTTATELPPTTTPIQTTMTPTTTTPLPELPPFEPFKCDFEDYKVCGFIAEPEADFHWQRTSGSTESKDTGPSNDHTYRTKDGNYMFIETSYPRLKGESAGLATPPFNAPIKARCLSFWYHMYGSDTGSLNVYLDVDGDRGDAIWSKEGNQGDRWNLAYVGLDESRMNVTQKVVMKGVVGMGYHGDIAIDDFEINEGTCPNAGASCNFETDICGYFNSRESSLDWVRTMESNDSMNSRSSEGSSVLTLAANGKGFDALLVSPLITPSLGGDCLSFWYSISGTDTASLNILLTQGETEKEPFWTRRGSQVETLVNARVTIEEKTQYNIVFDGFVGIGVKGKAVLDDISFTTGPCLNEDAADCDFEDPNLCGYVQSTTDDLDWTWNSGSTGTFMTGPSNDHTFGRTSFSGGFVQGHYLYLESSPPAMEGDKAVITSPPITGTSDMCLQFWYHMFGHGIGTINVYTKMTNDKTDLIYTDSGNKGNRWLQAEAMIASATVSQGFKLVFEAERGRSFRGDLAIDDIKINSGGTCTAGTKPTCEDSDRQCPLWAELGDCFNRADTMLETCKRSCDNCGK